jgi:hypothetical protein
LGEGCEGQCWYLEVVGGRGGAVAGVGKSYEHRGRIWGGVLSEGAGWGRVCDCSRMWL